MSSQTKSVCKRPVDGVILPVAPTAAIEEGLFSYYGTYKLQTTPIEVRCLVIPPIAYSSIVNVLDYSAGSFPVTFADRSLDFDIPDYEPMNLTDRTVWRTCKGLFSACATLANCTVLFIPDQKDLFDGAPVGLQVMGRRLQEEKVIGLMEVIYAALEDYTGSG